MRRRLNEIMTNARPGDRASLLFDIGLVVLILVNVLAMILESVEPIRVRAPGLFAGFETFSVIAFTIEYVLRLWTCTCDPRFAGAFRGSVRYALTPLAIVDLLAVLPFYLPFLGIDLRVTRVFRLVRVLRLAKLARYTTALSLLATVLRRKKDELVGVAAMVLVALVLAASLMYFAERDAQPDAFGSIPASAWWTVTALTPMSQADLNPVTPIGRFLSACVSVLGLGMIALPTGIIGAGFVEEIGRKKSADARCPHCGGPISDD